LSPDAWSTPDPTAGESLAAEFVECLNRTAEIGAAVDPVS
jgi:hypothetical protein